MSAIAIEQALQLLSTAEKREVLPRFFKTGPGEYGEGDKFLGVVMPNIRIVAHQHRQEPLAVVQDLLLSPWHECRMCALLMLVDRSKRASLPEREQLLKLYLANTAHINNWDLVDLSAPAIVGEWALAGHAQLLHQLINSPLLWEQRIAVVSTLTLIRKGEFGPTLRLCKTLLARPGRLHHLMQKAAGWMLREVGKRNEATLTAFLNEHATTMPRTMLRYAIERLISTHRRHYMQLGKTKLNKS